jgi:signal transduction histidine kinase
MAHDTTAQPSFFKRFFSAISRVDRIELEKARLEAFLSAFPGEYCGLAPDGSTVYSDKFCEILSLQTIQSVNDIQNALSPSDSAAFEGMMARLQENGTPFTLTAQSQDESRNFKISGSKGEDRTGKDKFLILWIEDITSEAKAQSSFVAQQREAETEFTQIRTALDSIPRPVWLRNPQQDLVWVNTTYCNFLDMDVPEIIEQQKEITSSPRKRKSGEETLEAGKNLAAKALESGTVIELQAHGTFHGKRLLLKLSEIPLTSLGMTLGIAYNVTREEELENELKRFQSSTHELMEQLHSAIAIFNIDQKLEFYNSAFAQLWSLDSGWLNRRPSLGEIMEKLRENRRLPEQSDFKAFKQSWLDMFINLIQPKEDMLYLPNNAALRMVTFPHTMGGLMMIFEDVSSRLELESSYNILMAVQRETLDNLAEGVAVYGSDGRLKLWNPAFTRMWALNPEDVENQPHINRIIEKKKAFFPAEIWAKRQSEFIAMGLERSQNDIRLERRDKNDREELIDIATVPLPDGGILMTFSDVTDKVAVENALREKANALETAEQLKMDFLANVSYQLRTPLNTIMGFADIMKEEYFGKLNERQKEYTANIGTASRTLLDLINDILDLSSLEAGYLELDRQEFCIKSMLDNIKTLVSDWARKEQLDISIHAEDDIGTMNGDQRRIQQAIINVIRNALTYTRSEERLEIKAIRKKNEIHFTIKDSQSALSQADKAHIFQPFQRAQAGKRATEFSGTNNDGLSLSLVRSIIEAHGGKVDLKSDEKEGTIIRLSIPLIATKTNFKVPAAAKAN